MLFALETVDPVAMLNSVWKLGVEGQAAGG